MRAILHGGPHDEPRAVSQDDARAMLVEIDRLRTQIRYARQQFERVGALCNNPHWTSERRWTIARIAHETLATLNDGQAKTDGG